MQNKYIPLRVNRDFGDTVSTYFDFFKQNIKNFTNVFLRYNGIFLIALLIISYLMVSGMIGIISSNFGPFGTDDTLQSSENFTMIGVGFLLFILLFIVVGVMNYGLASSYMIKYDETESNQFDKKEVWNYMKSQLGSIILFVLLMIPIYLGFLMISIILAFIPLLGMFAQYILQFFLSAWLGVSFYDMLQNKKGIIDALGEGWKLVTKNFWRSVGANFVLGLLIFILMMVVLIVPGVILGVYTFHAVENEVDLGASAVATVIYTFGMCLFLVVMIYGQCLSQFINGILYYGLHEKEYNINTRKKIDQIGEPQ